MQQVDLTPRLLLDFSEQFIRVPNVLIQGGEGIPFHVKVLSAWFQEISTSDDAVYFGLFQAWLCGRDQFVIPELTKKEYITLVAQTVHNEFEKGGR